VASRHPFGTATENSPVATIRGVIALGMGVGLGVDPDEDGEQAASPSPPTQHRRNRRGPA
jgi:hypothetical protein